MALSPKPHMFKATPVSSSIGDASRTLAVALQDKAYNLTSCWTRKGGFVTCMSTQRHNRPDATSHNTSSVLGQRNPLASMQQTNYGLARRRDCQPSKISTVRRQLQSFVHDLKHMLPGSSSQQHKTTLFFCCGSWLQGFPPQSYSCFCLTEPSLPQESQ